MNIDSFHGSEPEDITFIILYFSLSLLIFSIHPLSVGHNKNIFLTD